MIAALGSDLLRWLRFVRHLSYAESAVVFTGCFLTAWWFFVVVAVIAFVAERV